MLLKNNWVGEEIKREIKRYIEMNENDSTTYQNIWDMEKAVIKEKFHIITVLTPKTKMSPHKQ